MAVRGMRPAAWCLAACLGLQAVWVGRAWAQSFPAKPVRVATQFSVGSGPDIVLRVVAERLASQWGYPVVVENRAGANGILVMDGLKRAPATGHELAFVDFGPVAALPILSATPLSYDAERDFIPVTGATSSPSEGRTRAS